MSKEAMKLALEALEYIYEGANNQGPHTGISWRCVSKKAAPVITALRQALANEALDKMAENARELGLDYEPSAGTQVSKVWWEGEKLMAKPIPLDAFYAPAQQKSVAVMQLCASGWDLVEDVDLDWLHTLPFGTILYTSPPQRTWVGLTDSEIQRLGDLDVDSNYFGLWYDFAKSIEAKLKEKNT